MAGAFGNISSDSADRMDHAEDRIDEYLQRNAETGMVFELSVRMPS